MKKIEGNNEGDYDHETLMNLLQSRYYGLGNTSESGIIGFTSKKITPIFTFTKNFKSSTTSRLMKTDDDRYFIRNYIKSSFAYDFCEVQCEINNNKLVLYPKTGKYYIFDPYCYKNKGDTISVVYNQVLVVTDGKNEYPVKFFEE